MTHTINQNTLLDATKKWFKEVIAQNHIMNTKRLSDPSEFNINPFLVKYLARYMNGSCDAISIAKALIYPRVLGTSINTSFGTNVQKFVTDVLGSFGSIIPGIDIEFFDQLDGRKKYCQIKLGPATINNDDVETINRHFTAVRQLAKTNHLKLEYNDLVVAVLYGEHKQLSGHYKKLEQTLHFPVYAGLAFWQRLTGDEQFYQKLSDAISDIAVEFDSSALLSETVRELSETAEIKALAE